MITGHAPLQSHLFRLQVVDTRVCSRCSEAPETVAHFLLRCPAFAGERHAYLTSNGLEFLNLPFLFSSPTVLTPLFQYIRSTGRFSGTIG
ncbi:hypothetical protein BDV93DRAFT_570408 [Ceratobasidium sp. AG-I]|nr:hypothetical protein BDV93DRAFT_570408 [Ceratobasidium sp. AG-I]